jgi:hypothetical protein
MLNLVVGCLSSSEEKIDPKKWDFFQGDACPFSKRRRLKPHDSMAPKINDDLV